MESPTSFRSLHLRLRTPVADALTALAEYDTAASDRKVYTAELHRKAVRGYIDKRASTDPAVAVLLETLAVANESGIDPDALLDRVSASD